MIVKIFSMKECPKCASAKEFKKQLDKEGVKTEVYDVRTVDGLAEATLFGIMGTPSVVVVDDSNKEMKTWRSELPTLKEIKELAEKNVLSDNNRCRPCWNHCCNICCKEEDELFIDVERCRRAGWMEFLR